MAITGGVKFFEGSKILAADGATITASTGDIVSENAIDKNPITFWTSVGSNDATTETLTITFTAEQIDRILLQNHNFKDFNVQYWNGSAWTHFANVVGIDGAKTNITETAFADDTAYYEFAAVTTTQLRVQVLKTQTANAQKFVCQIIATLEIGTFNGFPKIKSPTHSRNSRVKTMLSGKVLVQKGIDSFSVKIDLDKYPVRDALYRADLDLAMTLFDEQDPFLVWLCGGRRSTAYFNYTARGMRPRDVYLMQLIKDVQPEYVNSVYLNAVSITLDLEEHV
jgi:hypothetical protein